MSPKLTKSDDEPSSPRSKEPKSPLLGKSHIPISKERQKSLERNQKDEDGTPHVSYVYHL